MAQIGGIRFDNDAALAVIAGPCMLEPCAMEIALRLKEISERTRIPIVFKASYDKANRQSISSPRGDGIEAGLRTLGEIKMETGLPILTDIHHPEEAARAAEVADCLQIPAFLCRQTDLVVAAAETGRTVNIKKGQFLAPDQMKSLVEKALSAGAKEVLVTERGASFGYGDLVFDPRSLDIMKHFAPVVFDVTHAVQKPSKGDGTSGGDRRFVPALARAAAAVGIAGLFIETHPDPQHARSDKETQWPLDELEKLLRQVMTIDAAVKAK